MAACGPPLYILSMLLGCKLLYGLQSSQLLPSSTKRLETLQLKVLRKILKVDTTFINRGNTNQKLFRDANQQIREEGHRKHKIKTFIETYTKFKRHRAIKIIRKPNTPIHNITFRDKKLNCWIHPNRRVGRPRMNWTEETIKEIWVQIQKEDQLYRHIDLDTNDEGMVAKIKQYARNYSSK